MGLDSHSQLDYSKCIKFQLLPWTATCLHLWIQNRAIRTFPQSSTGLEWYSPLDFSHIKNAIYGELIACRTSYQSNGECQVTGDFDWYYMKIISRGSWGSVLLKKQNKSREEWKYTQPVSLETWVETRKWLASRSAHHIDKFHFFFPSMIECLWTKL